MSWATSLRRASRNWRSSACWGCSEPSRSQGPALYAQERPAEAIRHLLHPAGFHALHRREHRWDLIVERVEPLEGVTARLAALRKLRVVDPACGSGAFLIAAYEAFESAYEAVLYRLRVDGRKAEADELARTYPDWILSENLFGVDLSKESVEITQLALWIRSARKGKTLADLSRNIVCGNSLVADSAVHERAWTGNKPSRPCSLMAGSTCVIGNPPWERISSRSGSSSPSHLPICHSRQPPPSAAG